MRGGDAVTDMCISAANYIIEKVNEYNKGRTALRDQIFMSSKRLQKLLFFSDVLYMVENEGRSMITDEFYAWPSGPVIPSVYDTFMQYQDGAMQPYDPENHILTDETMQHAIDRIFDATSRVSTIDLVTRSHEDGGPWASVYVKGDPDYKLIDKNMIYTYYTEHGVPYCEQ